MKAQLNTDDSVHRHPPGDRVIRVLSLMEATTVTGPAKNVIEFARSASQGTGVGVRVETSFVTFCRKGATTNGFIEAVKAAGLHVDVVHERRALDLGVISQLRSLVAERNPDIIQSHNFKSHFLVRLARLHRKRRWVVYHHGYTWTDSKNHWYNQLDRWSMRAADAVITVCRPFALELESLGIPRERIIIRHNMVRAFTPVTPERSKELRTSLGIPADALVLLSVGRLSSEKGFLDLVEAIGQLPKCDGARPLRFVVAGDGPEKEKILDRAAKLEVGEKLILAGHRADLSPFYTMAEAVVIPSHSEGSPNVLLEALAAGQPVVATAVGGVPEIAEDGKTALLVEKSDVAGLAAAIGRITESGDLRRSLGAAGLQRSLLFSCDSYSKALSEVYGRIMETDSRN